MEKCPGGAIHILPMAGQYTQKTTIFCPLT
jgi:lysine 2,3-aminomutase